MLKHFVTFLSPGTFVCEVTTKEVDSWDIEKAKSMAAEIVERHSATPFGFRFSTMESTDWEPRETAKSGIYYLPHCKVETLADVEARDDPRERILRENMRINRWDRVVTTTKGWKATFAINDDDVVLA
jgi:hypothetical protein